MKRLILVLVLFAIISTSAAFADHPKGLGIGLVYGTSSSWGAGNWGNGYYGLSLKVPAVPVFWGIHLRVTNDFFALGLMGDKYFIDSALVKDIGLHWFLGLGLYGNIAFASESASFGFGARLPIGLSWQPVNVLELFLNLAPSLGINVNPLDFPAGGLGAEFGIRLWL
jgi:hypothetical protein